MKTLFKHLIPVAACAAVAVSCSADGNAALGFDNPVEVKADSIAVNEILRPIDHAVVGDKAVVMSAGSEDLFYVYGLPDFKFLYSTGKSGEGPDDFGRCKFLNGDATEGVLYMDESSKHLAKFFSVDDNNFNNKGQIVPIKKDGVYLRERAVASGGRWLLSSTEVNGDELGRGYLYVIETETRKITDSVLVHTLVKEETMANGGVMVTRYNDVSVWSAGDAVAVSYSMIPRMDFYRMTSNGKLKLIKTIGDNFTDEETMQRFKALEADKGGSATRFCDGQATEKYLFILEVDIKVDMEARKINFLSTRVKVYDWDGSVAGMFELEKSATNIMVSPDGGCIFAYNVVTNDFDRVYTYRTGL